MEKMIVYEITCFVDMIDEKKLEDLMTKSIGDRPNIQILNEAPGHKRFIGDDFASSYFVLDNDEEPCTSIVFSTLEKKLYEDFKLNFTAEPCLILGPQVANERTS